MFVEFDQYLEFLKTDCLFVSILFGIPAGIFFGIIFSLNKNGILFKFTSIIITILLTLVYSYALLFLRSFIIYLGAHISPGMFGNPGCIHCRGPGILDVKFIEVFIIFALLTLVIIPSRHLIDCIFVNLNKSKRFLE